MNQVIVRGHQRAGNHYLSALIEVNLFDSTDSERHHDQRGHLLPNQCLSDLENGDILNVFIHRNFPDTLDSIYRMRRRLALNGTKEDLFTKNIEEFYDPKIKQVGTEVNWHFKGRKEVKSGVSTYFSQFPGCTLEEWHKMFVSAWLAESYRTNVYVCAYENLLVPMGRTMVIRAIAGLLRRPLKWPVKDIGTRVGYYQKDDDTWG